MKWTLWLFTPTNSFRYVFWVLIGVESTLTDSMSKKSRCVFTYRRMRKVSWILEVPCLEQLTAPCSREWGKVWKIFILLRRGNWRISAMWCKNPEVRAPSINNARRWEEAWPLKDILASKLTPMVWKKHPWFKIQIANLYLGHRRINQECSFQWILSNEHQTPKADGSGNNYCFATMRNRRVYTSHVKRTLRFRIVKSSPEDIPVSGRNVWRRNCCKNFVWSFTIIIIGPYSFFSSSGCQQYNLIC